MTTVKHIDPTKVALLEEKDYKILLSIADLFKAGTREEDFPDELYAAAFKLMRDCGCTNLRNHSGMIIVATQLNSSRKLIERVRNATHIAAAN